MSSLVYSGRPRECHGEKIPRMVRLQSQGEKGGAWNVEPQLNLPSIVFCHWLALVSRAGLNSSSWSVSVCGTEGRRHGNTPFCI